jgi:hypothetical protein
MDLLATSQAGAFIEWLPVIPRLSVNMQSLCCLFSVGLLNVFGRWNCESKVTVAGHDPAWRYARHFGV